MARVAGFFEVDVLFLADEVEVLLAFVFFFAGAVLERAVVVFLEVDLAVLDVFDLPVVEVRFAVDFARALVVFDDGLVVFFAAGFFDAVVEVAFLAVVFFAAGFFAAGRFAAGFAVVLAVAFFAVVFFATGFFAAGFLAAGFFAAGFLAAVIFEAVFFAAGFAFEVFFFVVVGFFFAVEFFFVVAIGFSRVQKILRDRVYQNRNCNGRKLSWIRTKIIDRDIASAEYQDNMRSELPFQLVGRGERARCGRLGENL